MTPTTTKKPKPAARRPQPAAKIRAGSGKPRQVRSGIDPRIRERRVEVAREAGRKRLKFLMVFLGLLLVGVAVGAVTQTPALDVDHVEIIGSSHTGGDAIRTVGGLRHGRLLLDVHPGASARAIETLPWVERATVTRHWPATVRVAIRERVAAAVVARPAGGYALVDRGGRVLRDVAAVPAGLLAVRNVRNPGPPGTTVTGKVEAAVALAAVVPPELRARIEGVGLADDGFHLGLRGGGVVRMGGTDQLAAKLRAVVTVLTRVPSSGLAILDVRVPRAPVLTRR